MCLYACLYLFVYMVIYVYTCLCDSVGVEILEHKSSFLGRNVKHARRKLDSMQIFIEFKELIM